MDEFKKLEEIGLKEVSIKTHIEVKTLKYMIDSQFDKLNRSSTIGFVKILTRDYGLDLQEWLNEAEKYWSENKSTAHQPEIFLIQKSKNISKIITFVITIVALIAILYGAYIYLNTKTNLLENSLVKNDTNFSYAQTPVVNQAKKVLEKNATSSDINSTVQIEANQTTNLNINEKNVSNISVLVTPKKVTFDQNNTKVAHNNTDNIFPKNEDYISPKSRLWVGIIYLDNLKRSSFIGLKNLELNASRDQLITTGHGNFTLQFNGKTKIFKSQNPIRLFVKNGEISIISEEKFKGLNKGSLW